MSQAHDAYGSVGSAQAATVVVEAAHDTRQEQQQQQQQSTQPELVDAVFALKKMLTELIASSQRPVSKSTDSKKVIT